MVALRSRRIHFKVCGILSISWPFVSRMEESMNDAMNNLLTAAVIACNYLERLETNELAVVNGVIKLLNIAIAEVRNDDQKRNAHSRS